MTDPADMTREQLFGLVEGLQSDQHLQLGEIDALKHDIERSMDRNRILIAENSAANARERPAFMCGYDEGYEDGKRLAVPDREQSWQEYRCQDASDWKAGDSTRQCSHVSRDMDNDDDCPICDSDDSRHRHITTGDVRVDLECEHDWLPLPETVKWCDQFYCKNGCGAIKRVDKDCD